MTFGQWIGWGVCMFLGIGWKALGFVVRDVARREGYWTRGSVFISAAIVIGALS